jgi:hypothetical protein
MLLPVLTTSPDFSSSHEQRSFQYFRFSTGPDLASDYDSNFWTALVLRFCHVEPSVRHAVLAVSSFHESLACDHSNFYKELSEQQVFALKQYNRAISLLRRQMNSFDNCHPIVPLLLCVLFACIEFMQKKIVEALTSLQQGRRLLVTLLDSERLADHDLDLIRQHVVPVFLRASHTCYLFGFESPPVPEKLNAFLDLRQGFSSVQQARHAFYAILDDCLRWRFLYKASVQCDTRVPTDFAYQANRETHWQATPLSVAALELQQQALLSRLCSWNTAFSVFMTVAHRHSSPTPSLLLLQIFYLTATIWTSTTMSDVETVFDMHIDKFSALLPLCSAYLAATMPGSSHGKCAARQESQDSTLEVKP